MPRGVNMYDEGRIQERNFGLADGTQIVSPGFIADNLVYLMDVGNAACYPTSGTKVYDISGYNINEGSFNDSPEATFLIWLYRNGAQLGTAGLIFYSGSLAGLNFFGTTNNLAYHWNAASATFNYNSGLTTPSLAWSMAALSVYPDRAVFTLCQASGTTTATNTTTHSPVLLNGFRIGHTITTANRYFKGNIAIAAIYDRALSPEEITQNFTATRARFGI